LAKSGFLPEKFLCKSLVWGLGSVVKPNSGAGEGWPTEKEVDKRWLGRSTEVSDGIIALFKPCLGYETVHIPRLMEEQKKRMLGPKPGGMVTSTSDKVGKGTRDGLHRWKKGRS